jgi:peroxiredoxin
LNPQVTRFGAGRAGTFKMMLRALLGTAAMLVVLAPARVGIATVGARPPDFTLRGAAGAPWKGTFKLSEYLGKRPVVITFTATWCAPCELEMMALEKERARLESRGLVVVAIAIDDASTAPQVGAMARRLKVQFPVVTDVDSSVTARINPRRTCPFMISVDRSGKIVRESEGWTAEHMKNLPKDLESLVN